MGEEEKVTPTPPEFEVAAGGGSVIVQSLHVVGLFDDSLEFGRMDA